MHFKIELAEVCKDFYIRRAIMVTIAVGKSGVKVYIDASLGFWGAGGVRAGITDSKGNAYIDFDDFGSKFSGKIYVAGEKIYEGEIQAEGVYS